MKAATFIVPCFYTPMKFLTKDKIQVRIKYKFSVPYVCSGQIWYLKYSVLLLSSCILCINKENGFGGRRVKSVKLVLGERLHQITPASGEISNKIPSSDFVSEKKSRRASCHALQTGWPALFSDFIGGLKKTYRFKHAAIISSFTDSKSN